MTDGMKQRIRLFFLTTAVFAVCFPANNGYAFDYQFGAEVFEGVFKEDNFTDESEAFFDYDATYNIFAVYPDAYINFNDNFNAYALAELEWFYSWDDQSADDKSDLDATLANIFLNYTGAGLAVDVGLVPFSLGKGVVFYSDEPGIAIRYDGWQRTYFKERYGFRPDSATRVVAGMSLVF